jgi:TPP-dependent trihydroxycyclohexane-1,2-dione (THcHDO) dehydratase
MPLPPFPFENTSSADESCLELADVIDDVLGKVDGKDDYDPEFSEKEEADDDKSFYKSSSSTTGGAGDTITDADALKTCTDWKSKYSVVIGVSWGNLPYDLQQKWMKNSCDYHLTGHST